MNRNDSRRVKIGKKESSFKSRVLKSGETAYYRDGKRAKTPYQIRLAKGILAGLTPAEARGHPFAKYSGKLATKKQIQAEFAPTSEGGSNFGEWAARPSRKDSGSYAYYVKVSVKSESLRARGSPDGNEEACRAVTLRLLDPNQNSRTPTFTYREATRRFGELFDFTIMYYKVELCNDDASEDLLLIWRHAEK